MEDDAEVISIRTRIAEVTERRRKERHLQGMFGKKRNASVDTQASELRATSSHIQVIQCSGRVLLSGSAEVFATDPLNRFWD